MIAVHVDELAMWPCARIVAQSCTADSAAGGICISVDDDGIVVMDAAGA